jgi:uncharacterized protein YeeX (DUF496 family)
MVEWFLHNFEDLKELGSFIERLSEDKEENIQEILIRKKEICEEIHKIRKSLNDHLDQLHQRILYVPSERT